MPPPNLKFAAEVRRLESARAKRMKTTPFNEWLYLKRSNIVMHTSIKPTRASYRAMSALYRMTPPLALKHCKLLAAANLDRTNGPRPHYRIRTPEHAYDGKFLVFGTGNIIVAGTKSHASAALASSRMLRLIAKECPGASVVWPSMMSVPNAVITGRLKRMVSDEIKASEKTNSSPKFPGIALRVPEKRVTPELYLRRCMLIIPGVTSANVLHDVLGSVETIVAPYQGISINTGPAAS
jgi:TATA-box binding protein (TBP) (component of TFIID and TFIIIB)